MKPHFFYCETCGNVIMKLIDSGVTPTCCNEPMIELQPNEIDGVGEKHLPVITICKSGSLGVTIGEKIHPMLPEHMIVFIALETRNGGQIRYLKAGSEPHADFCLSPCDKPVAVYAYCNVHGLWVTQCP